MAATAYAFLVSLLNTMDQIQSHPSLSTCFDYHQFPFLREKVDFFLDFVENYYDANSKEAEDLVRRIAASAHEAEDKIEVEAADQMRSGSTRKSRNIFLVLQGIIEDMNSIKEKVIKVREDTGFFINSMPPPPPPAAAAAPIATRKKTKMVGFEGYEAQLLDELTSSISARRILPIVGMGGIGKTTLARNAFENLLMLYHFDVRAWVTVSQDYNATEILSQALDCLGGSKSRNDTCGDEVGELLRKTLYGRRYLIVLDDLWSVKAWEEIQFCFPDNNNGSRIVVTTRQRQVVDYFASFALAPNLLNDKNSWELFCEETFGEEGCPPELELVGRKVVEKCKGLPLAISVIGGLLGKSPWTREYWEKITQDRSLVLEGSSESNQVFSILYLSYKFLPVCLRSCFLYLGLFPEDHQIDVSQLIKLYIAEGFIKTNRNQSPEEIAESYIKELVDRNLLLVGDLRLDKKLKTCNVHDVVRELGIRLAKTENFQWVQRDLDGTQHLIVDETSASLYSPESLECSWNTPSLMRPLVSYGEREEPFKCRLLRVWNRNRQDVKYTFGEVNLRFLSCYPDMSAMRKEVLPSSISLLWTLQTLVVKGNRIIVAPSEIWKMPQLRHVEMTIVYLPDPPPSREQDDDIFILRNLQTLKRVNNLNLSQEVCKRIPNVKELEMEYNFEMQWNCHSNMKNLGCFNKLEILNYYCIGLTYPRDEQPLHNLKLPTSLKELTLAYCHLARSDMAMIASLPHLQSFELMVPVGVGKVWDCAADEFPSLKHMGIVSWKKLIKWSSDSYSFPVLETLILQSLSHLKEIPSAIGQIPTLKKIEVRICSRSALMSLMKILEEIQSLGNEDLQVLLVLHNKTEADMWRKRVQKLSFTYQNLHISDLTTIYR